MFAVGQISWLYFGLGLLSAALVSLASARMGLINKKSELLHLSLGFYRHFLIIFIKNFFSSIFLILKLALGGGGTHPTLHKVRLHSNARFNPALLMASFNMSSGLFCIDVKGDETGDELVIHAIDPSYFKRINLQKICLNLRNINDDNLI